MTQVAQVVQGQEPSLKVKTFMEMSSSQGQFGRKLSADAIRLARREAVWELRCRGYTQERIVEILITHGIVMSQSTVSRDLDWCFRTYRERLLDSVGRVMVEHVGTLEYILEETMAAWEESKLEALEVQRKSLQAQASTGQAPGQPPTAKAAEQTTKVKSQTGEPAYLREARAAMADIRKIIGADRPSKVSLTDPTGEHEAKAPGGVVIVVPSRMTLEEALEEKDDPSGV